MNVLKELTENPQAAHVPDPDVTFGEKFGAGWAAETIRTDAYGYEERVRDGLRKELLERLPPDGRTAFFKSYGKMQSGGTTVLDRTIMDEIGKARSAGDPQWQNLPASLDEFNHEVDRRRKAELDEAENLLGIEGPGLGGFLGTGARAMTDPASLMLMPFGAGGSLARLVISEALLGAAGEALVLPREFEVAEELDLETPNVGARLAIGAAFAGGLAGGLHGVGRMYQYSKTRRAALTEGKPATISDLDFGDEVNAAYEEMSDVPRLDLGETSPDTDGQPSTLKMGDFDYSPEGNASPKTNRIGYVFGRLLELGYEPHHAAALTGNLMQESGVGLNTGAVGDGGNAYGMGQWNGPRRHAYLAFAKSKGKAPNDLDTQIAWLDHELKTTERAAAERILAAPDARTAAAIASKAFWRPGLPHLDQRMGYAAAVMRQYEQGQVPKWKGAISVDTSSNSGFTGYGTTRGYTGTGQILVGDDLRIEVEYQVVDLADLEQASGDLQPRDRARASSDAWVSDTAAQLDPALLMISPTADRGAPLVGPDGVIESGNGRMRAIERTYEKHPDRADAYRRQIELTTGKSVSEAITRPVLIARRTTDLDASARQRLVVDAQDSGVARMNATERAQIGRQALNAKLLSSYQPGQKLRSAENRDFARNFAGAFPRSERNAFIDKDGKLSIDGVRQLSDALFARAYDAPDILARYVETEAGDMRSLLDALADAAPEIATLRAEIDAGHVRPEMDITAYVLDAMRLIMTARDLAAREGSAAAKILEGLLSQVDLLDGAIAPLTQALVRKFMPDGKQIPAAKVSQFLERYAKEARVVGRVGDAFSEEAGPLNVLQALDKSTFGDLDDLGRAQLTAPQPLRVETDALPETAFLDGARSPDAILADEHSLQQLQTEMENGPFGPVIDGFEGDWRGAVKALQERQSGEVPGALQHTQVGPIALVWGKSGKKRGSGFGLVKIMDRHPEVLDDLQARLDQAETIAREGENRIELFGNGGHFVISRDWAGTSRPPWLLTAYDEQQVGGRSMERATDTPEGSSPSALPLEKDKGSAASNQADVDQELREAIENFKAAGDDFTFRQEDGSEITLRDILDDLDADENAEAVIDACTLGGKA